MFVWSAACVYEGLRQHQPALSKMMDQLRSHTTGDDFLSRVKTEYDKLAKISIDYALMEKADNVIMTRAAFDWDDVGAWPALEGHLPKDERHNSHKGATAILDAGGNVIVSDGRLVALIGVNDLVVVQSEGVVLVCPKNRAQDIKKMVEQLRAAHRTDVL
jgi:mannose-1-phosphate guanylyltransferase